LQLALVSSWIYMPPIRPHLLSLLHGKLSSQFMLFGDIYTPNFTSNLCLCAVWRLKWILLPTKPHFYTLPFHHTGLCSSLAFWWALWPNPMAILDYKVVIPKPLFRQVALFSQHTSYFTPQRYPSIQTDPSGFDLILSTCGILKSKSDFCFSKFPTVSLLTLSTRVLLLVASLSVVEDMVFTQAACLLFLSITWNVSPVLLRLTSSS
jgi:hypothetical protein